MSEKEDYFNYVAEVLGVKALYVEASDRNAAQKTAAPLVVAVENLNNYSADEKDLLEKMVAALKIDLNKIKIIDLQTHSDYKYEFLLMFSENPQAADMENKNTLTTYSPRVLVKNTTLKKQVWSELQKVIQYFST
jgi:ABC-type transporter Mla subunit MlaD